MKIISANDRIQADQSDLPMTGHIAANREIKDLTGKSGSYGNIGNMEIACMERLSALFNIMILYK